MASYTVFDNTPGVIQMQGSFSSAEFARLLGISSRMFMRMYRNGEVPPPMNVTDRQINWRWQSSVVEAFVGGKVKRTPTPPPPRPTPVQKAQPAPKPTDDRAPLPESPVKEFFNDDASRVVVVKMKGNQVTEVISELPRLRN